MMKFFGRKPEITEADIRAMAESQSILQMRIERLLHKPARNEVFEVEYEAPAGAGTVSMSALASKAQSYETSQRAA